MIKNDQALRLIFGFKIKHRRLQAGKSYQELAQATGLSVSYLSDIEKGKKYPKPDKIQKLGIALEIDYNDLVSTRSNKKIKPVVELLNSDFFKFFPAKEFGISLEKFLDVFSNSPEKFGAFISTILKMVRSYQIEKEDFYLTALRSYQDIHDNYFPNLEKETLDFKVDNNLANDAPRKYNELMNILRHKYNIIVDRATLGRHENLYMVRSFYNPDNKVLYLNKGLSEAQENFILAKEIGFKYLNIEDRLSEINLKQDISFEKLLNNFQASYFAAASMMDYHELVQDLEAIARSPIWKPNLIGNLLKKYHVTPETLLQRLSNVLSQYFKIKDLFFIRLNSRDNMIDYDITKELHLSRLHKPYRNELNENLCHRWMSISSIKTIRNKPKNYLIDAQISKYWQTSREYFCISIAEPASFGNLRAKSVTLGLLMNERLKASFNFIKDPNLKSKVVHTTCQRCSISDCDNRVAAPSVINQLEKQKSLIEELKNI